MNAIVLLATLLAQCRRVRSVEYSSFPAYDALIKAGLIEETGVVSSFICNECDQPHDAKIVYEGSQYGYYCPDLGFISKPRSEIIAAQPNLGAFVAQIADALACKRRKSSPIDKDTWRIGAVDSPAGDVVLYLHPTLQDAQDIRDIQAALVGEMKSPFGVVLTSKGTLSVPPYATAQLQDVLSLDPITGKLMAVGDLRTIAGVPEQRNGGRPNDYETALNDLIALRASQGRAMRGRNEEAKALRAEFMAKFPNAKCPSLPTVKRYVTKTRSGS
ncbi:hypothetical protein [Sulfitobacter pacificus]|uniref:hypothetical protein n=1 Tax=Sulfitobacter pacificus TaxID=1499314 RepID=UPI003105AC72